MKLEFLLQLDPLILCLIKKYFLQKIHVLYGIFLLYTSIIMEYSNDGDLF